MVYTLGCRMVRNLGSSAACAIRQYPGFGKSSAGVSAFHSAIRGNGCHRKLQNENIMIIMD